MVGAGVLGDWTAFVYRCAPREGRFTFLVAIYFFHNNMAATINTCNKGVTLGIRKDTPTVWLLWSASVDVFVNLQLFPVIWFLLTQKSQTELCKS